MKKGMLIMLMLISGLAMNAQDATAQLVNYTPHDEINWVTLEEAQELIKKEPRQIIVDVYTPWCGPCRMMDQQTFHDAEVAKMVNENFYAVKFNAEGPDPVKFGERTFDNPRFDPNKGGRQRNGTHAFTMAVKLRGYPTVVVFNPDLKIVDKIVGFQKPTQFLSSLKKVEKKGKKMMTK